MLEKAIQINDKLVPIVDISVLPLFLRKILGLPVGQSRFYKIERQLLFQNGDKKVRRRRGWMTEFQARRFKKLQIQYETQKEVGDLTSVNDFIHHTNFMMRVDPFWREEKK
jgi:hypothetical protein